MKNLIISAIGLFALLTACTGISELENPEDNIVKKEVVIRAVHEYDGQTKTVLQEDGSVWWQPNDAIGVFFGTYCSWFYSYNMEDAPSANFIGEALIVQGHNENSNGNVGTYSYWGVFPPDLTNDYTEDYNFDYWRGNGDYEEPTREKESVNVYLPSRQKGEEGTFDSNYFISVARSDDYRELSFYNLCGGLAFTVETEGIHTVTFRGNDDETLAGGVNVVMNSEGRPVVNEIRNGKREVTLAMPRGDYFIPGEWYYMVMLPTTLEKGYSMTFQTDRAIGTSVVSTPVEVKRSVFGKLANPDLKAEFEDFIPVEYVEIESDSDYMTVGDTLALTAVIVPSDCTFPAEWTTSDPDVATVDENGNVVGVSEGEVRITLTVGDMSDYFWVYVYRPGVIEPEEPEEKVPSLTLKSLDLTDVYAITSIYDENYDCEILYTISENGETKPLRFDVESDNEEFEKFMEDTLLLANDGWVGMLTDKYLTLYFNGFIYDWENVSYQYEQAFESVRGDVAIRMNDYSVIESDLTYRGSLSYQSVYNETRVSYDGKSIYRSDSRAFWLHTEENGRLTSTQIYNYEGSQFDPNKDRILLDKDNNMLTYYRGQGYILCADNSIIPFNVPEYAADNWELGTFFEVDYTWYYLSGTRVRYEDSDYYYDRSYSRLYEVTLENKEVVFTELTNAYTDEYWDWTDKYYRRGNTFMFGEYGEYVVIDMDSKTVSYSSVDNYSYASHITPEGYYTDMQDGVLYKYDILSEEPEVIVTDRSIVPPMTPTYPEYDSTNHCYYECGTRLSDSVTITVVTDAETGKVSVYEGAYDSPLYVVIR